MFNSIHLKKEFGEIMGGKVLELESDRLIQQGRSEGLEQGRTQEKRIIIRKLLSKGKTVEEIAELLDMLAEQVRIFVEETKA